MSIRSNIQVNQTKIELAVKIQQEQKAAYGAEQTAYKIFYEKFKVSPLITETQMKNSEEYKNIIRAGLTRAAVQQKANALADEGYYFSYVKPEFRQ